MAFSFSGGHFGTRLPSVENYPFPFPHGRKLTKRTGKRHQKTQAGEPVFLWGFRRNARPSAQKDR
jgi:hypothetical protein